MEGLFFESAAYKEMMYKLDVVFKAVTAPVKETDKWMSMEEVVEYTGFSRTWVMHRKNKIGCFSDGKGLRFKKSNVDKYMEANSFKVK